MSQLNADPASRPIDWKAAIYAGLIAGLVFVVMEMGLVGLIGGGSPLGPPKMIAAIVLGPEVLPAPDVAPAFNPGVLMTGMVVHFVLSIVLAIVFALIVERMNLGLGAAIGVGAVFGLVIYFVNFYGFTAIWPWFAMARNAITIASHLVFGAVLGWTYHSMSRHRAVARY